MSKFCSCICFKTRTEVGVETGLGSSMNSLSKKEIKACNSTPPKGLTWLDHVLPNIPSCYEVIRIVNISNICSFFAHVCPSWNGRRDDRRGRSRRRWWVEGSRDKVWQDNIWQHSLVALWGPEGALKVVTECYRSSVSGKSTGSLEVVIYTPLLNQSPT